MCAASSKHCTDGAARRLPADAALQAQGQIRCASDSKSGACSQPLQAICTGFLAQSGVSIAGDQNKLCACLVDEAQKQLTREDMEAFSQAMSGGQQPPPEVLQKTMNVATVCLTQAR